MLQKEFSISRVSLTLFYLVIFAACRLSRMHPTVWSKAKGDLSLPKKNAAAKP